MLWLRLHSYNVSWQAKGSRLLMCREQAMYEEWIEKQSFLRQADRMVARVRHR